MTPIEIFKGKNPEELIKKFNGKEAEGWKPIPEGFGVNKDGEYYLFAYRSPDYLTEQLPPVVPAETPAVTEEQLHEIHDRLREIFPEGQTVHLGKSPKCEASGILPLFPSDLNRPMAKFFSFLVRNGFETVEKLLSFPEDKKFRNLGPQGRAAIRSIKEVLNGV